MEIFSSSAYKEFANERWTLADLQNPSASGEFEHLVEGAGDEVIIIAPELADRVEVWDGVGSETVTATFSKMKVSIRRPAKWSDARPQ